MKEKFLAILIIILISICGLCFVHSKLFENNDLKEYSYGLKEYKTENYQSAYRHFGKVSIFSDIKTPALFRQARSATLLGDIKGAKKNYSLLLFMYPNSELYVVSEYNLAMLLYEANDKSAKKHFKHIIKYFPNTDYALASEYYIASIDMQSAKKTWFYARRKSLKTKALNHFIRYVKLSPNGRFAQESIDKIKELGIVITPDNNLAIANSYFERGKYKEASEYYAKSPIKKSWAKYALNEFKIGNIPYAKTIFEKGIGKYTSFVKLQEIYDVIDEYVLCSENKLDAINYLLNKYPKSKCADYILYLKAKNSDEELQNSIYEKLYTQYPDSAFSAEALYNVFFNLIMTKNYDKAITMGYKHIRHFKTSDTSPAVFFWMGKIYEKKNNKNMARSYYKSIINRYPDSYYSYRAYCKLNKNQELFITNEIKQKPILFPTTDKKERSMVTKLINLGDYDFVSELYKDNEFVKSWIEYKQGKKVQSVITAQEAMKEIYPKPKFDDVRWQLVYPLNYYEYVDKYKGEQDPLMILSIIREESHFNSNIVSPVGAVGLMQLMPATANEIASMYGLNNNLTNPKNNIQLGCLYYSKIKSSLHNKDMFAIMAYNGGWFSVMNWLKRLHYEDIDEFVEKIPYPETQTYVKKVLRSYWIYSNIY